MANLRQATQTDADARGIATAMLSQTLTPIQVSAVETQFPDDYDGGIKGWRIRCSDQKRQP